MQGENKEEDRPHRRARRRLRRRWRILLRIGIPALVAAVFCARPLWRHFHHAPIPALFPPPEIVFPPTQLYPDPPGIVLHDSASPATFHGVTINAEILAHIHRRDHPTWGTVFEGKTYYIGYHYVILPNGVIEKGRPDHCPGAHARHHNDWIGICLIGSFSTSSNPGWRPSRPTGPQIASLLSLCERLMSEYHIPPERVKRHRDVNSTYCPGGRFPYAEVIAALKAYAATHPETRSVNRMAVLPPP